MRALYGKANTDFFENTHVHFGVKVETLTSQSKLINNAFDKKLADFISLQCNYAAERHECLMICKHRPHTTIT